MLGGDLVFNSLYLHICSSEEVTYSKLYVDNENKLQIKDTDFLDLQCLE